MYSALVVKSDDPGIWDDFFSEPLINTVMNDTEFRYYMENSFPEGNINRFVITGFIDNYEQSVESRIQEEVRKKEAEETLKKKEHARDWRALALGFGVIGLLLICTDMVTQLFIYQFLSIGSTFIGFGLCCGARCLDLYTVITGIKTGTDKVTTFFMKIGAFLLILLGWMWISTYGIPTNIYGIIATVISSLTTIATILMVTVFRPRIKEQ